MKMFSVNLNFEIIKLKQFKNKSLSTYYKRTMNLFIRVNDKDRSRKFIEVILLSSLKVIMLNIVMRFFVRDLRNSNVRKNILKELMFLNKFLLNLYIIIKKFKRVKLKYIKLQEKIFKT